MKEFKKLTSDSLIQEAISLSESIFHHSSWSSSIKSGYASIYGLVEEKLLGFIVIYDEFPEAEIGFIAVSKEKRKEGNGTLLLKETLNLLTKSNYKRILLEVRESNKDAKSLYEKTGFNLYFIRKGYYENNEDAYCYDKELGK